MNLTCGLASACAHHCSLLVVFEIKPAVRISSAVQGLDMGEQSGSFRRKLLASQRTPQTLYRVVKPGIHTLITISPLDPNPLPLSEIPPIKYIVGDWGGGRGREGDAYKMTKWCFGFQTGPLIKAWAGGRSTASEDLCHAHRHAKCKSMHKRKAFNSM